MCMNFDKSYPVVTGNPRLFMNSERFDVLETSLANITLVKVFNWTYTHFVLEQIAPFAFAIGAHISLTR